MTASAKDDGGARGSVSAAEAAYGLAEASYGLLEQINDRSRDSLDEYERSKEAVLRRLGIAIVVLYCGVVLVPALLGLLLLAVPTNSTLGLYLQALSKKGDFPVSFLTVFVGSSFTAIVACAIGMALVAREHWSEQADQKSLFRIVSDAVSQSGPGGESAP